MLNPHPKRTAARVLLSSVFGPYAQDDEFGSRAINPMELYHNQVTKAQGAFSIRRFHRSWGILMIQENIQAPCTVVDFPSRDDFARELAAQHYDIVGISSIIVNVGKVREMCRVVREVSPNSTIIVGGHVSAIPGIEDMVDADHIVKGDGIAWMREDLGEDPTAPVRDHGLAAGMQLLHHLCVFRRQGENADSVQHRRGALPRHGGSRTFERSAVVLHPGRELRAECSRSSSWTRTSR